MDKTGKEKDTRWIQRLHNFQSAFTQLKEAVDLQKARPLSPLEQQGLIQAFEFTHELAWNVMKDSFDFQGGAELITGSRDASREAFNKGLVSNGDTWMEMIKSRNQTSHTYNANIAEEIIEKIDQSYCAELESFLTKMTALSQK